MRHPILHVFRGKLILSPTESVRNESVPLSRQALRSLLEEEKRAEKRRKILERLNLARIFRHLKNILKRKKHKLVKSSQKACKKSQNL